MENLETRTQEPRIEMDYFDKDGNHHKILYYGRLDLLRQGAYELMIGIYNKLRGERNVQPKQ